MYILFLKRLIDFFISLILFLVISPVFLLLIIVLFIYYKGNPFFFQKRPGYKASIFSVIKFKSMIDKFDSEGKLLPDSDRITGLGYFLRKTSLDELPQLINVIKGDMSLIGPRPLLVKYLTYYTDREFTRHDVRPGITGLAQISGRNNLKFPERLELDAQYVEQISLKLDLLIFFKTIIKVLVGSDVTVIVTSNKGLDDYRRNDEYFIKKNSATQLNKLN